MGLAEQISLSKVGMPGKEHIERICVRRGICCSRHSSRPAPCQLLVELLGDAVVIAASSRPLHQPLLRFERAMPAVQDPGNSNVIDMADAGAAELLALPSVGKLIVV